MSPESRLDSDPALSEATLAAARSVVSDNAALALLPAEVERRPRVAGVSGDSVPMQPVFIVIPTVLRMSGDSVALAVRVTDVESGVVLASQRRITARREAAEAIRAMTRATLARAVQSKKERS